MRSRLSDYSVVLIACAATVLVLVTGARQQSDTPQHNRQATVPLDRQSTADLLTIPRTTDVCRELLRRRSVSPETLAACVNRLAALSHVTQSEILLDLVEMLPADLSAPAVENLIVVCGKLSQSTRDQLNQRMPDATRRAVQQTGRCVTYAMWITLSGDGNAAFNYARNDAQSLSDFLISLPLLSRNSLHTSVYADVRSLLPLTGERRPLSIDGKDEKLLNLAVDILVQLKGREAEKAADLIELIDRRIAREATFTALLKLPASMWPKGHSTSLAASVLAFIAEVPKDDHDTEGVRCAIAVGNRLQPFFSKEQQHRYLLRLTELTDGMVTDGEKPAK